MKLSHISLLCLFVLISNSISAQSAHFITEGTIEFEKTVNMYGIMKDQINKDNEMFMKPMYESFQKNNPQFRKLKSVMSFSKDKILYNPVESTEGLPRGFYSDDPSPEQNNAVYTDLSILSTITQKKVFEETFLVKDSTRAIKWKLTDDTREIAGYMCRRANAIIMDSIYVVAFYTEQIAVTGGPESFNGLPGMILGVALPHENVTWFATKVTETKVPPTTIVPPKKGKAVNDKELRNILNSAIKNWGEYGRAYWKVFLL